MLLLCHTVPALIATMPDIHHKPAFTSAVTMCDMVLAGTAALVASVLGAADGNYYKGLQVSLTHSTMLPCFLVSAGWLCSNHTQYGSVPCEGFADCPPDCPLHSPLPSPTPHCSVQRTARTAIMHSVYCHVQTNVLTNCLYCLYCCHWPGAGHPDAVG